MNLKTFAASAALAFALSGAALAQAPAGPNADPAAVQAGTYKVEPSHTRVLFSVSHMGFTNWYGDFTGSSGQLTIDPKNPGAAQVTVTIPTGTVSTTNATLDKELKAADWLDSTKFPTATFKSRKVTPTGANTADIEGDLTLHGVTKPLTLHAKFNAGGPNPMSKVYTIGFDATGTFRRSDFGVNKYVPMISDEVQLTISAGFEKAS